MQRPRGTRCGITSARDTTRSDCRGGGRAGPPHPPVRTPSRRRRRPPFACALTTTCHSPHPERRSPHKGETVAGGVRADGADGVAPYLRREEARWSVEIASVAYSTNTRERREKEDLTAVSAPRPYRHRKRRGQVLVSQQAGDRPAEAASVLTEPTRYRLPTARWSVLMVSVPAPRVRPSRRTG